MNPRGFKCWGDYKFVLILKFELCLFPLLCFFLLLLYSDYVCNQLNRNYCMADTDLDILKINERDEGAWKVLFHCFYSALCSFAENYVDNSYEAEDIVQETFLKIWHKQVMFNDTRHLTYYLYRAVYKNCLSIHRSKKNIVNFHSSAADHGIIEKQGWTDEDFAVSIREEMYRRLWTGIQQLSERRKMVIMKTIEGKSIKEIAEDLNISISTVKNTKAKAIDELRNHVNTSPLWMLL